MKIRRLAAAVLAVSLFALCVSACGKQGEKITDRITETSAIESSTNGTNENETSTTEGSIINSEAYVTLETTDTGFGIITVPKLSETMLNKESATMANKMFADIYNGILENIEEFKSYNSETPTTEEQAHQLCTVKTALVGTMLSVLLEYNYYFAAPQDYTVAVNFNTQTGEAVNPHEVVQFAGFTEDEVKAALRCFADRSLFNEWERSAFYELAETKSLPDGWGDPSYGWQDMLDDMVREYEAEPQPTGKEWDELLCCPTVFVDENVSLFVSANVPTAADNGYWTTMVKIGHSDEETLHINSVDRNGVLYKATGAMSENAAFEAVAATMGLDENGKDSNGVKCSMSAECIDSIADAHGVFAPAYIIHVFTDEETHIATVGRYAVGVFSGTVWEYDAVADNWNICPNGTGFLPEDIYTGMQEDSILAAVLNEPSELEKWSAPMVYEVDLIAYATGKSFFESEYETALVFAKTDNTNVIFKSGTMIGDDFEWQSEIHSVMLNAGECVLVYMHRPEGIPTQAIVVEVDNDTGCDSGTYILQHYGQTGGAKIEYITSGSAMG